MMHFSFDQEKPKESVEELLNFTLSEIRKSRGWFDGPLGLGFSRRQFWMGSFALVRLGAFVLLALGTVAPLLANLDGALTDQDKYEILNKGYLALVVAGLLLVLDQTLVLSKNWLRARLMIDKLSDLERDLIVDWSSQHGSMDQQDYTTETFNAAITLCRSYLDRHEELRSEDTASWAKDIRASIESLQARIDKELKAKKEKVEAADAARRSETEAHRPAALIVTLGDNVNAESDISLLIRPVSAKPDDQPLEETLPKTDRSATFFGLSPGQYVIAARGQVARNGNSELLDVPFNVALHANQAGQITIN